MTFQTFLEDHTILLYTLGIIISIIFTFLIRFAFLFGHWGWQQRDLQEAKLYEHYKKIGRDDLVKKMEDKWKKGSKLVKMKNKLFQKSE